MDFGNISNYTDYTSSLATKTNTEKLTDKVKGAQSDEELMNACKEFETYLWEQVIKSMKSTTKLFEDEESGANSQMVDYFMDSAITEMAGKLTDANMGPGSLAQQMFEQMKRYNTIDAETLLAQSKEIAEKEALEGAAAVTGQGAEEAQQTASEDRDAAAVQPEGQDQISEDVIGTLGTAAVQGD